MNKSQYKSLSEWRKANPRDYQTAWRKGYLDEICKYFGWESLVKPKGYWTKELCIEEAKKYKSRTEWSKKSNRSYNAARKNDWMDECCGHMKVFFIPLDSWTLQTCIEEARKYESKTEWRINSNSSYKCAIKNCWLDECITHMKQFFDNFSKEECLEQALKYKVKEHWKRGHNKTYSAARRNGWYDELTSHMVEGCKPRNYWTKERCHEEALKYKVKEHWKKGSPKSYQAAGRNGWYNELTTHMKQVTKPNGYWTKERCIENAKKFKTITEWTKANSTPVTNSRKHGWFEEATAHMKKRK
jgi:hypothetical protein